jgi:hypothetical protein
LNAETVPTFSLDPSIALPPGYKYKAQGSTCPPPALCDCPFLPSPSSTVLYRHRHLPPCHHRKPIFDAHGGKESSSPCGRMSTFFGNGEEARGPGSRWSPSTEDELEPAGVEGAAVQPPRAGAPRGLCGELHRLPREGAWDATEPVHAGAPALLQGGAPSPCP